MTTTAPIQSPDATADAAPGPAARPAPSLLWYLALGCVFGIVLMKSEVVSWLRIQEMFRFQSFQLYGVMGSALAVAAPSVALLRRAKARTLRGDVIAIPPKTLGRGYRYWIGGTLFGIGWALTGSCPGPMFALVGAGSGAFVVAALSALAGTWVYGHLRPYLPSY